MSDQPTAPGLAPCGCPIDGLHRYACWGVGRVHYPTAPGVPADPAPLTDDERRALWAAYTVTSGESVFTAVQRIVAARVAAERAETARAAAEARAQCGKDVASAYQTGLADGKRNQRAETARLRAEAWDEGKAAGFSRAMRYMSDEPNVDTNPPNPYRAVLADGQGEGGEDR